MITITSSKTYLLKIVVVWFVLFSAQVLAEESEESGFKIKNAQTRLVDKVYVLQASIDYEFSASVMEAIESGVPMVIVLEIELDRPRRFWWDKEVASLKQRFHLHYHALANQYVVKNLNSGLQTTAPTLHSALYDLRDIKELPLIDRQLLEPGQNYEILLKVSIEFDSLPVPLKLKAYTSRKWWLGSTWFSVELKQ